MQKVFKEIEKRLTKEINNTFKKSDQEALTYNEVMEAIRNNKALYQAIYDLVLENDLFKAEEFKVALKRDFAECSGPEEKSLFFKLLNTFIAGLPVGVKKVQKYLPLLSIELKKYSKAQIVYKKNRELVYSFTKDTLIKIETIIKEFK